MNAKTCLVNPIVSARPLALLASCALLAALIAGKAAAESAQSSEDDWPMWRYDAARSADTPVELAEDLHLQWERELPAPERAWPHEEDDRGNLDFDISYAPVVMGDKIFVPSNVTDSVTAYHIEDGRKLWRFYADGPVRLAPAAWQGRVYFTSDDGHLYCVDAGSGDLKWKFQAGPSDQRLLGNERIINFWAARGGPVIADGTVYFASGVWPLHGIFIYALDAENGEILWVNDTTSSDHVPDFKAGKVSAFGFDKPVYGPISPQGYIAASENQLVVSGGRGFPIFLNRKTGEPEAGGAEDAYRISARTAARAERLAGYDVHALDGGGTGKRLNEELQDLVKSVEDHIDGDVFYKLAARDRMFVTTECGKLYCFGAEQAEPRRHEYAPDDLNPVSQAWSGLAGELIEMLDDTRGYALMLGAGSGDLMREILLRSDLHLVVVESDPDRVRELREELTAAGAYGRGGAAVVEADPAGFAVQPYLFSLIVSENAPAAGIGADASVMSHLLERLRPYSGVAWLGTPEEHQPGLIEAAEAAGVDKVSVEGGSRYVLATRGGPLAGAGEWTHQYHDPAHTLLSKDELVRLPLGVLWFGGPTHHNIAARHSYSPRPQIVGGRQFVMGDHTISARCVYTGREIWVREFKDVGFPWQTTGPYRLGAAHIGSPVVSLSDGIYLRWQGSVYRLDPASGETLDVFDMPGRSVQEIYDDENLMDWGHISIRKDYLIVTYEPHLFEGETIGRLHTHTGTSSRNLAVLDRHDGSVLWTKEADIGFRHTAIVSSDDTLFVIDSLTESALGHLARRGKDLDKAFRIIALDLDSGSERWVSDSNVFGTFLLYSSEHDVLIEGGSRDGNFHHSRRLNDEPSNTAARRADDGEVIWETDFVELPGVIHGEMLIHGRPRGGPARNILTGEPILREQRHTGMQSEWNYAKGTHCDTMNASVNLLLYRSGTASYFDLEHDSGLGNFSGFRSGCTPNMIPADGVLNAPDYTRTCACTYPLQTSLALIHMPDDPGIEFWTFETGAFRDPERHGLNFGAPGRRVDGRGIVWEDQPGTHRRHPSAVNADVDDGEGTGESASDSPNWVTSSARESGDTITFGDLPKGTFVIRLHFAELEEEVQSGQRVFDVRIDGQTVLNNFDIVAETGGSLRGTVKEFDAETSSGSINVELTKTADSELDPMLSGIEISSADLN